ncbi:hypothetical protein DFH09DRAFT_1102921 [Mycena vulgaris]|nr:hypothetical protein DFH09DRAFT_1102921 [Mycena vulgaris]
MTTPAREADCWDGFIIHGNGWSLKSSPKRKKPCRNGVSPPRDLFDDNYNLARLGWLERASPPPRICRPTKIDDSRWTIYENATIFLETRHLVAIAPRMPRDVSTDRMPRCTGARKARVGIGLRHAHEPMMAEERMCPPAPRATNEIDGHTPPASGARIDTTDATSPPRTRTPTPTPLTLPRAATRAVRSTRWMTLSPRSPHSLRLGPASTSAPYLLPRGREFGAKGCRRPTHVKEDTVPSSIYITSCYLVLLVNSFRLPLCQRAGRGSSLPRPAPLAACDATKAVRRGAAIVVDTAVASVSTTVPLIRHIPTHTNPAR